MIRIEDASQSLSTHVSVYLRSCEIGVAEQLLHGPEIGAPVEEVGGEGVAQGVGVRGDR